MVQVIASHMVFQIAGIRRSAATLVAFVWPFSSVHFRSHLFDLSPMYFRLDRTKTLSKRVHGRPSSHLPLLEMHCTANQSARHWNTPNAQHWNTPTQGTETHQRTTLKHNNAQHWNTPNAQHMLFQTAGTVCHLKYWGVETELPGWIVLIKFCC